MATTVEGSKLTSSAAVHVVAGAGSKRPGPCRRPRTWSRPAVSQVRGGGTEGSWDGDMMLMWRTEFSVPLSGQTGRSRRRVGRRRRMSLGR